MYKRWTESEINNFKKLYESGIDMIDIEAELNIPKDKLERKASMNKIKRPIGYVYRKNKLNENYFDVIDTKNKAYILGYIFADGCNDEKRNHFTITLNSKDREFLIFLANELKYTGNIKTFNKKSAKSENVYNYSNLEFKCKQISESLAKLGCVQSKSLILKFPHFLNEELINSFILGYFDGDGTIRFSNDNRCKSICVKNANINFVGTQSFLNSLQNYFIDNQLVNKNKISKIKNANAFSLSYCGRNITQNIFNYFYSNPPDFYLKRKFDRFDNYLNIKKIEL